ncbi:hypothetical protein PRZ48_010282 [Zasmidium cellare]|uniref:Phosphatidylinositol-specific phospholipase C X domain-containing protein n=1 Tax=Zasmidium cellare TaxID=395010 RepID=A0ABR0E872_ZASCE|nr:hypothetical protein PRZ48_010282 [Zasmidium cellare]
MLVFSLITLVAFTSWSHPAIAQFRPPSHHWPGHGGSGPSLADLALQKVLDDASPVFGISDDNHSSAATWMRAYSDDTPIVHLNIPGTHDAATWNYSLATQQALKPVTDLANITEVDPSFYRCQDMSMVRMLDAGIRVFDLRYAYDVTKTSLVFWHGTALQSETATVEDILFGFYNWLDEHPSEALFLSFQHEGGNDDYGTQMLLYNALTSPASQKYIVQTRGAIGTLGQARGKVTLLRRFDLNLLPASYEATIPGIHFSPNDWTDNGPNITLVYNQTTGGTAYIEDYYQPLTPQGSSAEENIRWKVNATEAHLRFAARSHGDSLFWSFASSTNTGNSPPDTPEIQALGNGTSTPKGGVNQQLVPFLKTMEGKRLGILMFDFFEQPEDLVPLYLSLLPPSKARNYA